MVATRHLCRIATNKRLRIAQKRRFISFSIHLSKIEINELLGLFPGQQQVHFAFVVNRYFSSRVSGFKNPGIGDENSRVSGWFEFDQKLKGSFAPVALFATPLQKCNRSGYP